MTQDTQTIESLVNQVTALNAQLGETMSISINLRSSFIALQKENQRLTQEVADLRKSVGVGSLPEIAPEALH